MGINEEEAPSGFYAELKSSVNAKIIGNICRACDWRPECQKDTTDVLAYGHRCMSYPIVTPDGREFSRIDGESVVFNKIPS